MPNMRHQFNALLAKIEPNAERMKLASSLPGDVRFWLQKHPFETSPPHSRLSGSYARCTAILDIKDVDVLLFLPRSQLKRTPNSVLLDVRRVLDHYSDAFAEASGQRRSVHLEFVQHNLHLDIVPVVAPDGIDEPLLVPDRPGATWIDSDPLGYAARLSALNDKHTGKVVPLVKLVKAWRDVQMPTRRPKSYVLEVMVLYAVENGSIMLCDRSTADHIADFFDYIADKYDSLMERGTEAPRIADPQISSTLITRGWDRVHFETFMRRAREASHAGRRAVSASDDAAASEEWKRVFGGLWPNDDEVKRAARAEAASVGPGRTKITSGGGVFGGSLTQIPTLLTKYHGD